MKGTVSLKRFAIDVAIFFAAALSGADCNWLSSVSMVASENPKACDDLLEMHWLSHTHKPASSMLQPQVEMSKSLATSNFVVCGPAPKALSRLILKPTCSSCVWIVSAVCIATGVLLLTKCSEPSQPVSA